MRVLEVDADASLMCSWRRWLAPEVQPFFVPSLRAWPKGAADAGPLSPELRDTYQVWRLDRSLKTLWLDEATFFGMSRGQRAALVRSQVQQGRGQVPTVRGWLDLLDHAALRSQADGHRFVWWPSLLASNAAAILSRIVEAEGVPSRHRDVTSETWDECADMLPGARRLAGTFAASSGANCFGTVMAAAGVEDAADQWTQQRPFLDWLASTCRPGGRDSDPGTVLVWRDGQGLPTHAAITIGAGWALEKPSQTWSTPRVVLKVEDIRRINRSPRQRLERHHLRTIEAIL